MRVIATLPSNFPVLFFCMNFVVRRRMSRREIKFAATSGRLCVLTVRLPVLYWRAHQASHHNSNNRFTKRDRVRNGDGIEQNCCGCEWLLAGAVAAAAAAGWYTMCVCDVTQVELERQKLFRFFYFFISF